MAIPVSKQDRCRPSKQGESAAQEAKTIHSAGREGSGIMQLVYLSPMGRKTVCRAWEMDVRRVRKNEVEFGLMQIAGISFS
jgi:hypothetical protein